MHKLVAAITLVISALLFMSRVHASSGNGTAPPPEAAKFVGPSDTLLAWQAGDLFGPGKPGAVLIVRHPIPGGAYEFDRNPCDLIVLKGEGAAVAEFTRGSTAVDCVYNESNKTAGPMALSDRVKIKPGAVTLINQKDRGADRLYFKFSDARSEWYLERATSTFPGTAGITTEEASYPKDFPWTALAKVSPDQLAKALELHKTVEK